MKKIKMEKEIQKLINEFESKIRLDFDFNFEHWDNGTYDDSYEYGVAVGEEYSYREIVTRLSELLKTK